MLLSLRHPNPSDGTTSRLSRTNEVMIFAIGLDVAHLCIPVRLNWYASSYVFISLGPFFPLQTSDTRLLGV